MAYEKQTWQDLRAGNTPIVAARLNHMEDGIEAASVFAYGYTIDRPDPAEVGPGFQYYDTDLSIPIWSDGATWRDAAGNDLEGPP